MRLVKETFEVEDDCLTNTPTGQRHPRDTPFTFYLFVWITAHLRRGRGDIVTRGPRRDVVLITRRTEAEARRALDAWVKRHHAKILSARQVKERQWLREA